MKTIENVLLNELEFSFSALQPKYIDNRSISVKEFVVGCSAYAQQFIDGLKQIESLCDNQNPSHEQIWNIAYDLVKTFKVPEQ